MNEENYSRHWQESDGNAPGYKSKNCFLDQKEAVDSFDVEAGNNAEIPVTLNVCEEHLKEADILGYRFDQKYGREIEKLANERLLDMADYYERD